MTPDERKYHEFANDMLCRVLAQLEVMSTRPEDRAEFAALRIALRDAWDRLPKPGDDPIRIVRRQTLE